MVRTLFILAVGVLVIALPFALQEESLDTGWRPGDPRLVVISPHNEAIRFEFAQGFSRWHEERFGKPVKIDWRVIGGTSEIVRYLGAEYVSSFRGYWRGQGRDWPVGASAELTNRKFDPASSAYTDGQAAALMNLREVFRSTDDAEQFGSGIDLFFGGGEYDHHKVYRQGLTVDPWHGTPPDNLFRTAEGVSLIPKQLSGETWRTETLYGTALSTFGICFNLDRLDQLGLDGPPSTWSDLTDPRYLGQLGVADPTKSGSIAKAFEMMIHQQCYNYIREAGFDDATIAVYEEQLAAARPPRSAVEEEVPPGYQRALELGWIEGLRLVQLIGANARYFTDSASKVPIDVSMGNAAAGIAIDFYGRYQAESSRAPDGRERMMYVTPVGGSSVSCDPVSLLRGAPHRELAERFMEYLLSEAGQKLWNYRPGSPGGPIKFSLRRLPIRRDFYPAEHSSLAGRFEAHKPHLVDDFASDRVNPYALAENFTYHSRWTGRHFGIHRDLIRCMALDAGEELRAAWKAIVAAGGPEAVPEAMAELQQLPEGVTWSGVLTDPRYSGGNRMNYMREWTIFFRDQYERARKAAEAMGRAS